ncbi:MAG: KH domain-containing protein [Myxococcota bacterium]|nr:KH domain-containing protein [Myxococcota bacterium]
MSDREQEAVELIEFIAKAIVTEPEAVKVTATDGGNVLELETTNSDRGRVIGRQGRVAKAMRAVLAAASSGDDRKLDIVD